VLNFGVMHNPIVRQNALHMDVHNIHMESTWYTEGVVLGSPARFSLRHREAGEESDGWACCDYCEGQKE